MKSRIFGVLSCIVLAVSLLTVPASGQTPAADQTAPAALAAPQNPSPLNLITIPIYPQEITISGKCDSPGYKNAPTFQFSDGVGSIGTIRLVHDGINLYVCMTGVSGPNAARFASLYLDPQGNGITYTYAQQDDFSLTLQFDKNSTRGSLRGTGVGQHPYSYSADTSLDKLWSGLSFTDNTIDQVEYKVPLKNFSLDTCGIFGLAVYHLWWAGTGIDYGWPSNQWFDEPRTWQLATLGGMSCGNSKGSIGYVFRGNAVDALSYYALLSAQGYTVTLVPLADVLTTDFTNFDLTIIADDTGSLDTWGTPGFTTDQVKQITAVSANKPGGTPIIGLGEGGYAFFGRLPQYIGWPDGWHGPQSTIVPVIPLVPPFFSSAATVQHYTSPINSVGIYLPKSTPADVIPIGLESNASDHASLVQQGCHLLWGNSGNPTQMTDHGKVLFYNSVGEMLHFQCPAPPPAPAANCFILQKTANPDPTMGAAPGIAITYTLTYKFVAGIANCPTSAKLVDKLPFGTAFVPGSTGPGGPTPEPDGTLTWLVNKVDNASHSVSFSVTVMDSVCSANKLVSNIAYLRASGMPDFPSNAGVPVVHTVTCPVVALPNSQPFYAESELTITPYPLVAGAATQVSLQVTNLTAVPQPVTVNFQTSTPAQLGIGLNYSTTLATAAATVPASGNATLSASFIAPVSGNACIQALVTANGGTQQIITQSCLDVTENIHPGDVDHTLSIPVRNNTTVGGDVTLVVDNTCPGWSATINPPSITLPAGSATLATLHVTPPATGLLGSGCHIDVQAWIFGKMIGGVRKMDVPPVHLPLNVQPPWEEQEISFRPNPPQAGVAGQICIQLVNPLAISQAVSVDFSVADFGAGIAFTSVATLSTSLPPNSNGVYCANWTPVSSGTLHRCVLATLRQTGYLDQHSQRNIEISRPQPGIPASLVFPFVAGNPDLVGHTLTFDITLTGIGPGWTLVIEPRGGGVLPNSISAGAHLPLQARLTPSAVTAGSSALPLLIDPTYGSQHSVAVEVLLDGVPSGGFSIYLISDTYFFLPFIRK